MFQNETDYKMWEKLSSKIKMNDSSNKPETNRKARKMYEQSTIQSILNGDLILLDNSKNNQNKIYMFPTLPFAIGHRRYKRTLFTFFINKNATNALNITKL